jgi:hypothetical protein
LVFVFVCVCVFGRLCGLAFVKNGILQNVLLERFFWTSEVEGHAMDVGERQMLRAFIVFEDIGRG